MRRVTRLSRRPPDWVPARPSWYALLHALNLRLNHHVTDDEQIRQGVLLRYPEACVRLQLLENPTDHEQQAIARS